MASHIVNNSVLADVSSEQAIHLLKLQRDIMEKVAYGHEQDYQLILDQLCKATESLIEDAVASIMLFDETHSFLQVIAAPSLPISAIEALNGLKPGENAGSCGTAVFSNEPQFVYNTHTDPRWSDFKQYVIDFSVGACWSMPIKVNDYESIGSFALSSFEERKPSLFHIHLLETSAQIASIVIKRQKEQEHLWKMAHYDSLTQLPNRTLLALRLQHALEKTQRNKKKVALLFLDLDNFKDINDTQGHEEGDKILQKVASEIKACLRPGDTFARLGGDEFVIIIDSFINTDNLHFICKKILDTVKNCPTSLNFALSTSIGVSIAPDHGDSINILMRNADTAMYEAKSRGRSNFHIYQHKLTQAAQDKLQLSRDMPSALSNKHFIVEYQPQYDNRGQNILGIEALVRWQHPERGLIPPFEFISIAEDNGFIKDLGFFVLEHSCKQCLSWWEQDYEKFILAINLSVKQLQPGFTDQLSRLLISLNFPISQLELEITESMIMQSEDMSELIKLKNMGLNIAMDDFGTGHSSLAQVKCLPISKLKIDRSFVRDIPHNQDDITMARTIIKMGHSLGLEVVAEGVETEAQKLFLAEEKCDILQGYLLSKPVPGEKLEQLLKQQNCTNS